MADTTTIASTANFHCDTYADTSNTPIRSRKSMTSGSWKPSPNPIGITSTNPSHSLIRGSGSSPSVELQQVVEHEVEHEEEGDEHPGEEQTDADGKEGPDPLLLVHIQARRHERPELVEDPRAREHDAYEQRRLHVDAKRLLGRERGDAHAGVAGKWLPEEHGHEGVGVEGGSGRVVWGGSIGGRFAAEHPGQPVGVHLPQFERHAVLLDGVTNLILRVGEFRAVRHAGLPRGRGLESPLCVVVAERPAERILDEVDDRPGHEESEEHGHGQARRGADQARAELLEVLAERHRRGLKQVVVGGSRHGGLGRAGRKMDCTSSRSFLLAEPISGGGTA